MNTAKSPRKTFYVAVRDGFTAYRYDVMSRLVNAAGDYLDREDEAEVIASYASADDAVDRAKGLNIGQRQLAGIVAVSRALFQGA